MKRAHVDWSSVEFLVGRCLGFFFGGGVVCVCVCVCVCLVCCDFLFI